MSQPRTPWLFLKRVNAWNPLAGIKHLMPGPNDVVRKPQQAEILRERRAM